jgi:hypothetical protein
MQMLEDQIRSVPRPFLAAVDPVPPGVHIDPSEALVHIKSHPLVNSAVGKKKSGQLALLQTVVPIDKKAQVTPELFPHGKIPSRCAKHYIITKKT